MILYTSTPWREYTYESQGRQATKNITKTIMKQEDKIKELEQQIKILELEKMVAVLDKEIAQLKNRTLSSINNWDGIALTQESVDNINYNTTV